MIEINFENVAKGIDAVNQKSATGCVSQNSEIYLVTQPHELNILYKRLRKEGPDINFEEDYVFGTFSGVQGYNSRLEISAIGKGNNGLGILVDQTFGPGGLVPCPTCYPYHIVRVNKEKLDHEVGGILLLTRILNPYQEHESPKEFLERVVG